MTPAPRSVILIAGCSAGFGHTTLKDKGADVLQFDVTASPSAISAFAAEAWKIQYENYLLRSGSGQIEFLLKNTGYLQGGIIEENTPKKVVVQLDTNVFGLLRATNAFLPYFRMWRAGTIVNISSCT
ncbi:hypothetical protein DFH08DRAFT_812694 [Mycena albidolilacea]|uniref:Uncharacterized protein n=1 Tax=Mycena albidolilacea TaxID=1033008 RepID=A0AAD7EM45_9AGAR|nr:hypothetical protein DFH08DRAFT_812694 [Mycena albidolilacea]